MVEEWAVNMNRYGIPGQKPEEMLQNRYKIG
jgi:hypothetical protein